MQDPKKFKKCIKCKKNYKECPYRIKAKKWRCKKKLKKKKD